MNLKAPDFLLAQPCAEQAPLLSARPPVFWVVMASLSRGGAERIVLDWLADAQESGIPVRLAILHKVSQEWPIPDGIEVIRATGAPEDFLADLVLRINGEATRVYAHLVRDAHLEVLWRAGFEIVPTVHNAKAGWRNDPVLWHQRRVPFAIAVSDTISAELAAHGCRVPLITIRHKPRLSGAAFSLQNRVRLRAHYRVTDDELLIGMVGSLKAQKNYQRAFRVLKALQPHRKAKLVIAGGHQGADGVALFRDLCCEGMKAKLMGQVGMPGFVDVEPHLAAFDVVLNTSDFEGLSIATQEALFAGLPVVASNVGGQAEIKHPRLHLVPAEDEAAYVEALKVLPIRHALLPDIPRQALASPKLWTAAALAAPRVTAEHRVLFVTANLNAGGAQRSLVNLVSALKSDLPFSVAVTGVSTHPFFYEELQRQGISVFRPCGSRDVADIAASLLAQMAKDPVQTVCFWNVDPKLKLLMAKFLPEHRLIDVSPGHYAFEEMASIEAFGQDIAFTESQFYAALETTVFKYHARDIPAPIKAKACVIPNGVHIREAMPHVGRKRLVVQGRIAESKQLDLILAAMPLVWDVLDCELHIYGQAEPRAQGLLNALWQQSQQLGERVIWQGARPDLAEELGAFDGAVVLGIHQGCPNAVLEALAAGVPVVANDSGGTRELVLPGKTGVLLPEKVTVAEVADAILQLFKLNTQELRRHAKAHAAQFSMPRMRERYLEIFKELNDVQCAA